MSSFNLSDLMVKSRVKMLRKSPFFGTLLLNAPWREDKETCPTAATDGATLYLNPDFVQTLSERQFNGLLLHEVLHMALQHVNRLRDVFKIDPATANVAADIVVNGIIDDNGMELPDGAVRDPQLKHLSVREIYNILKQKQQQDPNYLKKKYNIDKVNVCLVEGDGKDGDGENQAQSDKEIEGHWKDVLNKAATIARMKKAGPMGAGISRILNELLEPTIDWRTILYKYITECKNDFDGYDRRFAYNNMYLDDFSGQKVHLVVYIDASGSIDEKLLTMFLSEINGAINSVSHVTGEVLSFDTELFELCDISEVLSPDFKVKGGGGTCFRPALKHACKYTEENPAVSPLFIFYTDGYADLTKLPTPTAPLLWALTPGSIDSDALPFGDVVRIMD